MTIMGRSLFTRRHYTFIAEHLCGAKHRTPYEEWITQVMQFAAVLKQDNPNFITVRFMQACGMTRGQANRALEGRDEHDRAA